MTTTEIISAIREDACDINSDIREKEIFSPHDNLNDDLGLDSLDVIDLTMRTEKRFDIEITDSEVDAISTVSDIAEIVHRKLEKKAGTGVCQ